jgi:hypothetical protein
MPLVFPAHLLALVTRAWEVIQAGQLTVDTARAVHEGVTAYAAEAGVGRYEVEMGVKKAVRHAAST